MYLIKRPEKRRQSANRILYFPGVNFSVFREIRLKRHALVSFFKKSSILFTIAGGILLALNIDISRYGFLLLAGGSSQLILASLLCGDRSLIAYSLSLFLCVDCLGVWRWVLN